MAKIIVTEAPGQYVFKKRHKFRIVGTNLGSVLTVDIAETNAAVITGYQWTPSHFVSGDSSNDGEFGVKHDGTELKFFSTLTPVVVLGGNITASGGGDGMLTITLNPVNDGSTVQTPPEPIASTYLDPSALVSSAVINRDDAQKSSGKVINIYVS